MFMYCRIFSLKPTKGIVEPQHHKVFVVKIEPKEVKTYKHKLVLNLNDAKKNTQVIYYLKTQKRVEYFVC